MRLNATGAVRVSEPAEAVTVFQSACVDESVALKMPSVPVMPLGGMSVLGPLLATRVTDWLGTALPNASRTVAVMVAAETPSAGNEPGFAVKLDPPSKLGAPAVKVAAAAREKEPI